MTIPHFFNLSHADISWQPCLAEALQKMDPAYLETLYITSDWLPGHDNIFNAFSLPVSKTNYVLFGESPYPRSASANGYAFWDAAVQQIWSETGLSKPVNRATSLRHLIKMLLIAEGKLTPGQTTQPDIAALEKNNLVQTNNELFQNFIRQGFLLLNATPVLQPKQVRKDANAWQPFVKHILDFLFTHHPQVELILFGQVANLIDTLVVNHPIKRLYAEHPYNVSFVENQKVINFFQEMHLLCK